MFQRVLKNSQVFVGKQITPKKMAPVVEMLDSAIHWINPYPVEKYSLEADFYSADQKDQPNCVIAGLPRARSTRGAEPHTHGIWSTSFRLVVT